MFRKNWANSLHSIAMAKDLWELSCHHGAELIVWGLRGLTQQIDYQITLSKLIVFFVKRPHLVTYGWLCNITPSSSREPSSCMRVGYNKSYHSIKQYRILRENFHKSFAKAINGKPWESFGIDGYWWSFRGNLPLLKGQYRSSRFPLIPINTNRFPLKKWEFAQFPLNSGVFKDPDHVK